MSGETVDAWRNDAGNELNFTHHSFQVSLRSATQIKTKVGHGSNVETWLPQVMLVQEIFSQVRLFYTVLSFLFNLRTVTSFFADTPSIPSLHALRAGPIDRQLLRARPLASRNSCLASPQSCCILAR